ncbi:hypothetical protein QOZ98_000523 [Planomicrobium stackebrandtii]|uniref:Uncharacterized protein n=1 Tax=Planomicrobium stackebrandtii TaxID=253160 RepID=A0ABU0GQR5_9BACL|nr:hypothetical protein [Planomicrobium stackebrandtii]MDQ0427698.1 hypothetical protein [Planomicrobium stackebrandtii]
MTTIHNRKVGEKYRPTVEIVKAKKDRVTVININGEYYRLDLDTTQKEEKAKNLPLVAKKHRLKQMGRT